MNAIVKSQHPSVKPTLDHKSQRSVIVFSIPLVLGAPPYFIPYFIFNENILVENNK